MNDHVISTQQTNYSFDTDIFMQSLSAKAMINMETKMEAKFNTMLQPIEVFQCKLQTQVDLIKEDIESMKKRLCDTETMLEKIDNTQTTFEESLNDVKKEFAQTKANLSSANESIDKLSESINLIEGAASIVANKVDELSTDSNEMKKKWENHAGIMDVYDSRMNRCFETAGAAKTIAEGVEEDAIAHRLTNTKAVNDVKKVLKVHHASINSIASKGISSGMFGATFNPLGFQEAALRMCDVGFVENNVTQNEREDAPKKRKL